MKLERVDQDQNAGYPTLKAHQNRRNGVIKTAVGGLALAALAGGCCQNAVDPDPPVIMGEMPVAIQPTPEKLPGEPKPPAPPPDIIPEEEHPVLMGIMVAPTPPAEDEK